MGFGKVIKNIGKEFANDFQRNMKNVEKQYNSGYQKYSDYSNQQLRETYRDRDFSSLPDRKAFENVCIERGLAKKKD